MKRLLTRVALIMAGITGVVHAQQDPQFTQFMYNKLIYNPGYAGTSGAICGVAQFRQQWVSFPGAPQSLALAADMRLAGLPLGVGFNVITDKIGPMSTMFMRFAGSYNLVKLAGGTLGIGLDIGFLQKKANDTWITPEPLKNDIHIPGSTNPDLNTLSFDLGAGVFYQIPGKFYAGISSTHLPAQSLKDGDLSFKLSRHYYMMTGYTFQVNKWSKLTPNILYKTDVASSSLDLNLTYLWSDMIWIGGTYRLDDATAVLLGYQGKAMTGNALSYRIGYSYDFSASKLANYSSGSHEIVLGACYTMKVKKPTTYSDPRFLD
jgi:type IX secretion system PorP/SprF family membrane protein